MRHLVLVFAVIFPLTAQAASVEEDLEIKMALSLQVRAEVSDASNAAGDDYNIAGSTDGEPDLVDFYLRRFRPGFKGTYQKEWAFKAILNLDNTDRDSNSSGSRAGKVQVHQASVTRTFEQENFKHEVTAGLDYPFFNLAASQNSQALFLNQRASNALLNARGTGVGYRLQGGIIRWGVDVQNIVGDDSSTIPADEDREGMFYSTRVEITGPGDWAIEKWTESFIGKSGHGATLGIEVGCNQDDRVSLVGGANDASRTQAVIGSDLLVHWEKLSALAEVRASSSETDADSGAAVADVDSLICLIQAGWAMPTHGVVLEPIARYTRIDLNTDNDDETAPFSTPAATPTASNDYGNSGDQIEIGVNCYFSGHTNKLGLVWLLWDAESGDADASVARVQYQLAF